MRKVALLLICLLSLAVVANSKPAYAKSFITFVKSLTLKTMAPAHKAKAPLDEGVNHADAADQSDDDSDEPQKDSDDASTQDDEEEPVAQTKTWSAPEASSNLPSLSDVSKTAVVSEASSTSARVGAPRGDAVSLQLKPWKLCRDIKNLGDYITCWAVQVGTSIDFLMRASIVPLALTAAYAAEALANAETLRPIRYWLWAMLAIGSITGAAEVRRALVEPASPMVICSLYGAWQPNFAATPMTSYVAPLDRVPGWLRTTPPILVPPKDPPVCWHGRWIRPSGV